MRYFWLLLFPTFLWAQPPTGRILVSTNGIPIGIGLGIDFTRGVTGYAAGPYFKLGSAVQSLTDTTNFVTTSNGSFTVSLIYMGVAGAGEQIFAYDNSANAYRQVLSTGSTLLSWGTNEHTHRFLGTLVEPYGDDTVEFGLDIRRWKVGRFIATSAVQEKYYIWTNYVDSVSNFVFSFNTNRYELKNQTNVVFTNLVEEATGTGSDIEVHIHNTTAVTMGLVWPAYGAQHGYFFQTNVLSPILSRTTLGAGQHGLALFKAFGTNIFGSFEVWP